MSQLTVAEREQVIERTQLYEDAMKQIRVPGVDGFRYQRQACFGAVD